MNWSYNMLPMWLRDLMCRVLGHKRWRCYPSGRMEQRLMFHRDRLRWVCWRCRLLVDAKYMWDGKPL